MVYTDIPSPQKFQSDTTVDTKLFGKHRSPDPVVLQIDRLLTDYATVDDNHRPDVLYYLYLVTHFCRRKIEVTPKNTPPTGFQDPNSTLPKTEKISTNIVTRGTLREATDALYTIAQRKLLEHYELENADELANSLADTYECSNHELANDKLWMQRYGNSPDVTTVYLTQDGDRRRYKLRFRSGLAYRWKDVKVTAGGYDLFDTTDNTESEIDDKLCHFIMDRRGRIYAGFDKKAVWFKHSSLIGGETTLSAGRMKAEQGKIKFVVNDSGHYQPTVIHMINLLQRLSIYGMNLTDAKVQRLSDKAVFRAVHVLNEFSKWPDGKAGF